MDTPVWDRFERARSPAQVYADLQAQAPPPPVQPQSYTAPVWQQRENLARMSGISHPELMVLRSGVHPEEGHAGRMEARAHNQKIEKTRQRIRDGGGHDRDAEVALAALLFPDGIGKVSHGPEHY